MRSYDSSAVAAALRRRDDLSQALKMRRDDVKAQDSHGLGDRIFDLFRRLGVGFGVSALARNAKFLEIGGVAGPGSGARATNTKKHTLREEEAR